MSLTLAATAVTMTMGLHLGSYHVPDRPYFQNTNPGLFLRVDQTQLGCYQNSYDRTSCYVAVIQPIGPVDVMAGLVTGYDRRCKERIETTVTVRKTETATITMTDHMLLRECRGFSKEKVTPMLALSYAIPVEILGATPRLSVMSAFDKGATVFHLSVEKKFKGL